MAKAELNAKVVDVMLTLSEEEAKTMMIVCARIGGDPTASLRRHTDQIGKALKTVLPKYKTTNHNSVDETGNRAIYFRTGVGV